jgi:hypothetical protein
LLGEFHLCPHKKRSKSDTSQRREANALLRNFGIARTAQVVARQRNFVRSFATTATGVRPVNPVCAYIVKMASVRNAIS